MANAGISFKVSTHSDFIVCPAVLCRNRKQQQVFLISLTSIQSSAVFRCTACMTVYLIKLHLISFVVITNYSCPSYT